MDDVLVMKDEQGGTATLTIFSPMSRYSKPVLRIEADDISGDFGPGDMIQTPDGIITAGQVVAGWMERPGRTDQEKAAGKSFLSQM